MKCCHCGQEVLFLICSKCKEKKDIKEFKKNKKVCRECRNKQARERYRIRWNSDIKFREDLKKKRKNYRKKTKEERKIYSKEYRIKNKEKIKKHNQEYNHTLKGQLSNSRRVFKRREKNKKLINTLTVQDINEIKEKQNNKCIGYKYGFDCNVVFSKEFPWTLDHIIPLSKQKPKRDGLTKNNIQLLCRKCNSKKGNKVLDE